MKQLLIFASVFCSLASYGQDKHNYVHFNKLTVVEGTEFVIASIENLGKAYEVKSQYLLFINSKTGETNQVDFPADASTEKLQQIKIDSLKINLILVSARTVDLDGKNGIDWDDPTQLIILSADGKQKNQLTDNKFFVRAWIVNRLAGSMVVTGYYDTNNNNKHDKTDKSEIYVYNLATLKLVSKI